MPAVELLANFGPGRPDEIVFKGTDGEQHTASPPAFRTVIEALGLNAGRGARDRASFYTIRHTVATGSAKEVRPVQEEKQKISFKLTHYRLAPPVDRILKYSRVIFIFSGKEQP